MDPERLNDWQVLFEKALRVLDGAASVIGPFEWSFGGGTALMLRYKHRYSRDIDIFVSTPQLIGHLTPRLSPAAEALTDQIRFRADTFKARDIFDFATVAERNPEEIHAIQPILLDYRKVLLDRLDRSHAALAEEFKALDILDDRMRFDQCVDLLKIEEAAQRLVEAAPGRLPRDHLRNVQPRQG